MKTVLITGGRAPVALDFARKFHRRGWRVLVAESMPVHLCQHSKAVDNYFTVPSPRFESWAFIESLSAIIQREGVNLLLPTCEEVFTIAKGYRQLSAHCTIFSEPIERLLPLHSKSRFIEFAEGYGLSVPESRLINSREDARSTIGEAVVLKPEFSRFATEVIINPRDDTAINRLLINDQRRWLVQDFIAGRQICTYSIAHDGEILAHVAYETVITAGQGATIAFEVLHHPASEAWVKQFVSCYGFTGQIAFDFIESESGDLYAIECNPRAISGVHLFDDDIVFAIVDRKTVMPLADKQVAVWLAVLVYGWRSSIRHWIRTLIHSHDVVFSGDDPLPFVSQWMMLWHVAGICRRARCTLIEGTTHDIEWNHSLEDGTG